MRERAPVRVQLRRVKGWRMPPNTVSVARPSKWGNPFRVAQTRGEQIDELIVSGHAYDETDAVYDYRQHITSRLRTEPHCLDELRGKNLACWCPLDVPCHADVLLEIANAEK